MAYFPAGAVAQDLVVTATVLDGHRVAYDFQPHGTVFNTPIYIAQLLAGTELGPPGVAHKRPDVYGGYLANGALDLGMDGSATFAEVFHATYHGSGSNALVVFTTNHFSGYAMASGRKVASDLGVD